MSSPGAEWAKAMALLREVLAPQLLAEWQPTAPQAVYSTWVTVWLLVFQRLNQNASLVAAVAAVAGIDVHDVIVQTSARGDVVGTIGGLQSGADSAVSHGG